MSRTRSALAISLVLPALVAAAAAREERAQLRLSAATPVYAAGATGRAIAEIAIQEGWHVNSHTPSFEYLIPTTLAVTLPADWPPARIDYPQAVQRKFSFEEQPLAVYEGTARVAIDFEVPEGTPNGPARLSATLRYQACNDTVCLPPVDTTVTLDLSIGAAAPGAPGFALQGTGPGRGLVWMLLFAVFGGLILNAMPCVLPVLSLKVFDLVQSAGQGRRQVTNSALATALGIFVSFWLLATAAIVVRAAGGAVGWGIQFQNPTFVAFLGVVVVLFCLNLWGLFEVPLPGRLARLAAGRGPKEGLSGHFASGLFATLMATPCSAPFLGTALGFALAQPAGVVVAIFTAVALGMALPYLLLAIAPGLAKLLPRPGDWMDQLKTGMGFLLAASAVWIFYVLAAQLPAERIAVVQLALLLLALGAWLRHRNYTRKIGRRLGGLLMAFGIAAAILLARSAPRLAADGAASSARTTAAARLIAWQPWDVASMRAQIAAGRTVFVDVTADWCFTCKVNERVILETTEVAAAFSRQQVVAMKADWTNRNDEIARYLGEHGRAGIPFYALYRPGQEPVVFAELLTKGGLLAALGAAPAAAPSP
jgi:suppressor for copper-sensitivity B